MCKVKVAVDCGLAHVCTNVTSTPIQNEECDLYLQSGSQICLVIYANNMECSLLSMYTDLQVTWWMLVTSYMAHTSPHMPLKDMPYMYNMISISVSGNAPIYKQS